MMMVELSKYDSACSPASWTNVGHIVTNTEYAHAVDVPTATSVSIVAPRCRAARRAAR